MWGYTRVVGINLYKERMLGMKLYFEKEDRVRECTEREVINLIGHRETDFCKLHTDLKRLGIYIVEKVDSLKFKVDKYDNMLLQGLGGFSGDYILLDVSNDSDYLLNRVFNSGHRELIAMPTAKGARKFNGIYIGWLCKNTFSAYRR